VASSAGAAVTSDGEDGSDASVAKNWSVDVRWESVWVDERRRAGERWRRRVMGVQELRRKTERAGMVKGETGAGLFGRRVVSRFKQTFLAGNWFQACLSMDCESIGI
jgi:hypothetical protein